MNFSLVIAAMSLLGLLAFSELSAACFRRLSPFLEGYSKRTNPESSERGWEKVALLSWAFAGTIPLLSFCLTVIFFMDHHVHSTKSFIVGATVGSNIIGLGLLFGLILFSSPLTFFRIRTMNSPVFLFLMTVVFLVTCLDGRISGWEGALLWIFAIIYAVYFRAFSTEWKVYQRNANDAATEVAGGLLSIISILCMGFGFFLFAIISAWPFAAWLSVFGAEHRFPSEVLGVNVIAGILTFPWLVRVLFTLGSSDTQKSRSISNITHSCLLNILFLPGILAIFQPLEISPAILRIDLPILFFFTGLFASILMIEKQEGRALPGFIILSYIAYVAAGAWR